ncbi:MAG: PD-(D/E)XK nuclease family protein [Bacteroidales bacterium]|nr:PD-(D/E)XK nuclease family protein [Bacteroidales bacterium]
MQGLQQELNKLKPIECHEAFNVFRALRKESDEVQLHSRFIASLLDPNPDNPLNLGTRPLELLLKRIISNFHAGPDTKVTPGWNPSNWSEDKEIDILIEDKIEGFAIIVENKIYATDSNHLDRGQLEGYHRYITGKDSDKDSDKRDKTYEDKRVEVYYLTLDGHKPSVESLGTKEKGYLHLSDNHEPRSVKLIQYRIEICEWLNDLLCLDEVYNRPYVKSAIEQYRDLIDKLAGDVKLHQELARLAGKYPEEARKMIQCEDNLLALKKKDIFWHGIDNFLNELSSALTTAGYTIEDRQTPLYEAVTNFIFGHKKSDDIYLRIPDKHGCVWTIQSNSNDKGKFFIGVDKMTNTTKPKSDDNEDDGWFCRIDFEPEVCLNDLLDKDTFERIMVPKNREETIKKYLEKISGLIK